jgi:hypothetical protein
VAIATHEAVRARGHALGPLLAGGQQGALGGDDVLDQVVDGIARHHLLDLADGRVGAAVDHLVGLGPAQQHVGPQSAQAQLLVGVVAGQPLQLQQQRVDALAAVAHAFAQRLAVHAAGQRQRAVLQVAHVRGQGVHRGFHLIRMHHRLPGLVGIARGLVHQDEGGDDDQRHQQPQRGQAPVGQRGCACGYGHRRGRGLGVGARDPRRRPGASSPWTAIIARAGGSRQAGRHGVRKTPSGRAGGRAYGRRQRSPSGARPPWAVSRSNSPASCQSGMCRRRERGVDPGGPRWQAACPASGRHHHAHPTGVRERP